MLKILTLILSLFTLRAVSPTYIYMDVNDFKTVSVVLENDSVSRDVFFKFVRIEAPQDLAVNVCARGLCNPYDTLTLRNVQPFAQEEVDVEIFSGNGAGPLHAYLLAFDLADSRVRDSVIFQGVVPVEERQKPNIRFSDGILYGDAIQEVRLFDVQGKLLWESFPRGSSQVPISIPKKGFILSLLRMVAG